MLKRQVVHSYQTYTKTEHVEIEKVLIGLDIETYSQKEWNDAVRYLTGKILEFATKEAALAYIRDHKK